MIEQYMKSFRAYLFAHDPDHDFASVCNVVVGSFCGFRQIVLLFCTSCLKLPHSQFGPGEKDGCQLCPVQAFVGGTLNSTNLDQRGHCMWNLRYPFMSIEEPGARATNHSDSKIQLRGHYQVEWCEEEIDRL